MLTGYDSYCLYTALKLHFTPGTYDFFKYHGKTKVSVQHFEQRKDRYFFHKLARKYPDTDDLTFFLAASFFNKTQVWVRDLLLEEARAQYIERRKIKESLEYTIKSDLDYLCRDGQDFKSLLKVTNGNYPPLLVTALQRDIHHETIIVLDAVMGFLEPWGQRFVDTIVYPDFKFKCRRYAPFLGIDVKKFRHLIRTHLTT